MTLLKNNHPLTIPRKAYLPKIKPQPKPCTHCTQEKAKTETSEIPQLSIKYKNKKINSFKNPLTKQTKSSRKEFFSYIFNISMPLKIQLLVFLQSKHTKLSIIVLSSTSSPSFSQTSHYNYTWFHRSR